MHPTASMHSGVQRFKPQFAMEARRGDRTIREFVAKHEMHPSERLKRQAQEGLREVFADGPVAAKRSMRR